MISASSNTLKVSGRKLIQASSSSSQVGYAVQDVFMALISCLIIVTGFEKRDLIAQIMILWYRRF